MKNIYVLLLSALSLCFFSYCTNGKKTDNKVKLEVKVLRLDRDLQTLTSENLPLVRERYGVFFELFNTTIINIGNSESSLYFDMLGNFLRHDIVQEAYKETARVFSNDELLDKQFSEGLTNMAAYFPDMTVPKIVTYISGFNEALILTDSVIGVGLERFLGGDYALYAQLGLSNYMQQKMTPDRLALIAVEAWIASEYFLNINDENTLLKNMIHEGKLLYVLKQCFPEISDATLMGYTKAQYDWCVDHEQKMWEMLISQKLLYVANEFTIKKFTGEAPYTADFSSAAPGKAACWVGYRIVSNYMKRKSDVTLTALMDEHDLLLILRESRYNP